MTVAAPALPSRGGAITEEPSQARSADLVPTLDSIVFPPFVREHQDERRVRPALAVLFRVAVGPHPDYYVRRFVKYERTGKHSPSWHWPAFFFPALWAFYRKLWAYGAACALLPLAGALFFSLVSGWLRDSSVAWWIGALLFVWFVPAVVSGTFANTFYYRCIRRLVRHAERTTRSPEAAARRLINRSPTDPVAGVLFGTAALLLVASLAGAKLHMAYHQLGVRTKVAQAIATIKPLQLQVEDTWARARALPQRPNYGAVWAQHAYPLVQALELSGHSGRVRLDLGPAVPELQGRSILLAPAVDAWQKLRWLCIPIDIPAVYVPAFCEG